MTGCAPPCGAALLADEVLPALPLRQWVISFPFALRFLFVSRPDGGLRFTRVKAPEREELEHLVQQIAERVGRALERMGLLQRDAQSAWIELPPIEDTDAMRPLLGSSVTYRIAVGPQAGRKALVLRTITALSGEDPRNERVAKANGFSLHAGVSCEARQRELRERLARYIARPAVAEQRLTVNAQGKVVYLLKTPYRDGTTHVVFEPLDFIASLAALVPRPWVNLTRYHGVLAPNHRWRAEVTPSGRGRGKDRAGAKPERSAIEQHAAMTCTRRA